MRLARPKFPHIPLRPLPLRWSGRDLSLTLLKVAKLSGQNPRLVFGLVGILETRSTLGERIRWMLMRPWPKSARLGIKAAFALGILAAVLLPMSRAERKQSPPTAIQSNAAISAVYRGKSAEAWFEQADL